MDNNETHPRELGADHVPFGQGKPLRSAMSTRENSLTVENCEAVDPMKSHSQSPRLTELTTGGGCSCKIPAAELEALLADAFGEKAVNASLGVNAHLLCGIEFGDDAAVVQMENGATIVTTTDFFPPVVDDTFQWGRIAAANALSDVYAMGGEPIVALNLLAWPVDRLSYDIAAEVLRGGREIAVEASCLVGGGHSIQATTPFYGLAVTGLVEPERLLRNDAAVPGDAISLTKPLGLGFLNNRHKVTGEIFTEAIETMAKLNKDAAHAAVAAGARAATDVTGFGLLGHLFKMARASGVTAIVNADDVPYLDGAQRALDEGFIPGGSIRNLSWIRPRLISERSDRDLLSLADAQTSGGLLVARELPNNPVIGEFVSYRGAELIVR
jgi:selenide,water dikinase